MKNPKAKINNYNDGFIRVYEENIVKTNFGAKQNSKSIDNLTLVVKLAYTECSKRQQDLEFAESMSKSLNLKVKTRLYEKVKNNHKVVIQNTLYDIIYLDYDRKNREMYVYLEEVRELV